MSSGFCLLEEAFAGPVSMPGVKKRKEKDRPRTREGFVPGPLSGSPDPDHQTPEPMQAPTSTHGSKPEASGHQDFFPLPGETAAPEEWARAFMLDPSQGPALRSDGSLPVAGKSTLWRAAAAGASPSPPSVPISSDIHKRLDELARQLEALTLGSPMHSTAELFLFIAIGLLLLLAIDTLLRYATTIAVSKRMQSGGRSLSRKWH